MSKVKFFKMEEDNSDAVNAFLATVRVAQDGMFCSDGKLAIIYKEKDEVGMTKDEKIGAFSGHLSKWQGDLIANENLYRSFIRLVEEAGIEAERLSAIAEEKKVILAEFQSTYNSDLENEVAELSKHSMKGVKKGSQEYNELKSRYIQIQSELNTYKATFDAQVSKLSKDATDAVFEHANCTAIQKEYAGEVEKYKKAVDKANIMIEDIANCINDILSK